MPTSYIKKLHEQNKGSIAELEKKWEDAKTQAEKQDQGENWAYVTKIFQNMVGASAVFAGLKIHGHGRVVARADGRISKCVSSLCAVCAVEATDLAKELTIPKLNAASRLLASSCGSE